MSMFRSLQKMGGVITLFHNPTSKVSENILLELQKHMASSPSSENPGQYKYTIDTTTNLPTPEQFEFFKQSLHTHPICKSALKHAFPQLTAGKNLVGDLENIDTEKLRDLNTSDKTNLFVPPLVVDWDHKLLAVDSKGLSKIFDQYNGENA